MYLYIEMWNVTTRWMELDHDERRKLMNKMHERISDMKTSGVENLGWARNDEHTPYRSDYRYMTVWKMPSKHDVEILESNLKKVGWYDYFSQANSRGEIISQEDAINFLVDIEETSTSLS